MSTNVNRTGPADLASFLTYRREQSAELETMRRAEFERKYGANERMSANAELAYWVGFYSGQADAYRVALRELEPRS